MAAVATGASEPSKVMLESVHELADLLSKQKDDEARRLLDRTPGLLHFADDSGRSAVHFAALGGSVPLLQFVLQSEADVGQGNIADKEDLQGWTPLMIASSAGRVDVVRFLLSLPEVNPLHQNRNGQIALHYAASKNHIEIVSMLCKARADAEDPNARGAAGAQVSDKYGATPVHRAASQGHEAVTRILCTIGKPFLDKGDFEGNTALHLAAEAGYDSVAEVLIRYGTDLYKNNKEDKTALQLAKTSEFMKKLKTTYETYWGGH